MQRILACAFVLLSLIDVNAETSDSEFLDISLKCHADNNGVLEQITAQTASSWGRMRVVYKNGAAVSSSLATSVDGLFRKSDVFVYDVNASRNKPITGDKALGEHLIKDSNEFLKTVCLADDATKRRYYQTLEANKKQLGVK